MCVLDNTAQRRGQGKKQAYLEDSWHGADALCASFGFAVIRAAPVIKWSAINDHK
jgi:hypothetical protein